MKNILTNKKEMVWLSVGLFLLLGLSTAVGLYFRESWLWMDEVLSYIMLSDPSLAHLNESLAGSLDANPPLFPYVYWAIGHYISMNPLFLRLLSVLLFSATMTAFFWYVTRLVGNGVLNFVLISLMIYMTYQNFIHATGIRSYAILLPISCGYFITIHRLVSNPANIRLLIWHTVWGLLLAFCHNYGLFYLIASGAFFLSLLLWSQKRDYGLVLSTFFLIGIVWLVVWFPSFVVQAKAGQPHSWIPYPTVKLFFVNFGDLIPGIPVKIRWIPPSIWLDISRVILVVGLYVYIAIKGLKAGFQSVYQDKAFQFFLLSGFIYLAVITISLTASLVYTSIFISRYMWPSQLLIMYQLVYVVYYFFPRLDSTRLGTAPLHVGSLRLVRWLPVYALLLGGCIFYKVWKMQSSFQDEVLTYLPSENVQIPVFVERADYFLPMWYHKTRPNVSFLLNWSTASRPDNLLSTLIDYKVLSELSKRYHVEGIVPASQFNAAHFPHFYVIDEKVIYQIEDYIKNGQVRVIRELPIDMPGHRLLECVFQPSSSAMNADISNTSTYRTQPDTN